MKMMGIDYGSKRVGVALTNDDGTMAFPREVIQNDLELLSKIEKIAETENVKKIVIGHSLNRDGAENPIHEDVSEFIGDLTMRVPVPIELEPEQYTTQEAIRFQGRTKYTDASAAAIILNSYIMRNKNHDQLR